MYAAQQYRILIFIFRTQHCIFWFLANPTFHTVSGFFSRVNVERTVIQTAFQKVKQFKLLLCHHEFTRTFILEKWVMASFLHTEKQWQKSNQFLAGGFHSGNPRPCRSKWLYFNWPFIFTSFILYMDRQKCRKGIWGENQLTHVDLENGHKMFIVAIYSWKSPRLWMKNWIC